MIPTRAPTRLRFDLSRYVGDLGLVLGRNAVLFIAISILLGVLPDFLEQWLFSLWWRPPSALVTWLVQNAQSALLWAPAGLMQGFLCVATGAQLDRSPFKLEEVLARMRPLFWPLLSVSVVYGVLCALAMTAFVVPYFIVNALWRVAIPVVAVERTGVIQAFRRSLVLTRGRRWTVFWISVVMLFGEWLFEFILAMALYNLFSSVIVARAGRSTMALYRGLLGGGTALVFDPIAAAGAIALYRQLYFLREGFSTETLDEVFV